MAYRNKFYADYEFKDGTKLRLYVAQKDYDGREFYMGNLQGITLEVGGGSEPVYAPVVKTTLRFTLADAFDVGEPADGESCITYEGTTAVKNGGWEEFYTNDATKYRVTLANYVGRYNTIWQGFVTPDSWQEAMVYRGSITVVARDMLGTLSDVTFDAAGTDGVITVANLIQAALAKCQAPMSVNLDTTRVLYNVPSGLSVFAAGINVAAFAGKSWWEALTGTLESLGLVMRYVGRSGFYVTSLRYLSTRVAGTRHGCEFVSRSGLRTLDPPVHDISAEFNLKVLEVGLNGPDTDDFGTGANVTVVTRDRSRLTPLYEAYETTTKGLIGDSGDFTTVYGSLPALLTPARILESQAVDGASFYFLANTGSVEGNKPKKIYCSAPTRAGAFRAPFRLIVRQAGDILQGIMGQHMFKYYGWSSEPLPSIKSISLYIYGFDTGGDIYYYNGGGTWERGGARRQVEDGPGLAPIVLQYEGGTLGELLIPTDANVAPDSIIVDICHVEVDPPVQPVSPYAMCVFVPISLTMAAANESSLADEYVTQTIYNENYNVRIERSPVIGSVNSNTPGKLLANVLQVDGAALPNSWNWSGETTGYPLEVMVQAQVLQHYADAASIFTGSLHDTEAEAALPVYGYNYYGRPCLLMRGTYDFKSGFLADCALREFYTWEQVWGTFAPQYTEESRRGSGGGGGSSGGAGGGGGAGGSASVINALSERVTELESLIGEDEDHNAYVKPYESTARELKNAGGATFRDLNLIPKTTPGSTAHLEVVTINGVPVLHSTLPFYSDGSITAGGIGNGGGGGTGNAAWVNGYSGSETAESIGLNVGEVTHRLSLYGHKHAISDVFNGIGSATPAQGDTLVYGANGWSYGASGGVSSVAGLTGTITTAQLRTALGLGAAAYRGVASDITVGGQDLVPSGLLQTWVSVLQNAIGSAVESAQTYTDGKVGDLADEVANDYVAKVSGKGLSTNDFTNAFKTKLQGIATGAQVNVIETVKVNGTALAVSNKAVDITVPTALSQLSGDSTHQVVTDDQITTWNAKADASALDDYVTLAGPQTITGLKTFANHVYPSANATYNLGYSGSNPSNDKRWATIFATNLNITGGVYSSATTLSFYAGGATQVFEGTANYVALQKSTYINGGLYLHGNQSDYGQNIGTASKHWNRVYASGLYPLADDGVRIVYDSSVAGFRLYGNLIVSGQVVAGQTGSGSSSFPVSVSGSIIPTSGGLNLGSTSSKWGTLYATAVGASGQKVNNIYASTLHVDTLDYTGHIWGYPGLAEYVSSQSDGLTDSDIGMTPAILAGIKAGTVTHIALGPWNGDEPTSDDRAVVSPHLEVNYYGNYVTIYFRYAGSIYRLEQVSAGSTRSWRFRRN